MSLPFVSKAVLTAKEGGGYEEKEVEGKESEGSSRVTTSQPLFEPLRANKEQEEMEREEFQKSIMRGTLALDEEDCAHLDALQKQRQEREDLIKRETQSELEAFRAAHAVNRMEQGRKQDEEDDLDEKRKKEDEATRKQKEQQQQAKDKPSAVNNKPKFPNIVAEKRRKVSETTSGGKDDEQASEVKKPQKEEDKVAKPPPSTSEKPALSGLLAGYGSDSDSDSD